MKHKDYMKILISMVSLTVLYTANKVLYFNMNLFNQVTIMLLALVVLLLVHRLLDTQNNHPVLDFLLVIAVFMAGINLKSHTKFFTWLSAVYIIYSAYYIKVYSGERIKLVINLVSLAGAVSFLVLPKAVTWSKLYTFLLAAVLMVLQGIQLRLIRQKEVQQTSGILKIN